MATLTELGYPNLVNMAKRTKPDGSVEVMLADTLSKELPMLEDIPWVEGNLVTGHRVTAVNALPSPTWRKMNQGLIPTKGETLQYDESCGTLEAHSKIDVALAELGGNAPAYRMSEDRMFVEGISQEFARAILYESVQANAERIHGLAARYPASTGYTSSPYVVKAGTVNTASSQCHSIWIVTWDKDRVFGIYPKGSTAGLSHRDLGEKLVRDSNNNDFLAYVTQYVWKPGLCVKDFRYVTRIQWDATDTTNMADTSKALYIALENALGTIWKVTPNTRIYWDRTSRNKVAAQLGSNNQNYLQYAVTPGAIGGNAPVGGLIERFLGVPCRITDSLVLETGIS